MIKSPVFAIALAMSFTTCASAQNERDNLAAEQKRVVDRVAVLTEQLEDAEPEIRISAARALETIGPPAKSAVDELIVTLKDDNKRVRNFSARALGAIGSEAKLAIPALVESMNNDTEFRVRRAAVRSLGEIGPAAKSAIPTLFGLINESGMIETAVHAIKQINGDLKPAIPEFIGVCHSSHESHITSG